MEKYCFSDVERSRLEASRIPIAVYQFVDHRVVTLILSDGFCELFGYMDRADAYYDMDHDMYREAHPDDTARISEAAFRFATEGGKYEVIYRTRIKDSPDFRIVHARGEHVYTESGVRLACVWYMDEGTYSPFAAISGPELSLSLNQALREESALRTSRYDYLTALPSMTWFFEIGSARLEAIQAQGGSPALVFLDLHGMKYFNQKNGFAAGDKLLQGFARILAAHFGNDACSRLGQDHFAVVTGEHGLETALNQVFAACAALPDGLTLPVHAGIYLLRTEKVGISVACDRAKIACDGMRGLYTSCFSYYSLCMRDSEDLRQYVIGSLDTAIREKWIRVYYQPIVRAVSGKVCHEEALARWIDPDKGVLSPADIIPSLEDAGLVYRLDLFILEQVLEKLKLQASAGLHMVPQSVNLSRSDFDACDMVEEIRVRVDAAGLPRRLICVEITESVIGSDLDFMRAQVRRFQQLGFSVWMDDFGSGYSSLEFLESISFDMIKFDMHFLRKLDEGDNSKIILTQLVRMASALGVDTVCEGVETVEQVAFLKEIGCSKLQGFYFTLEEILERYRKGVQIGFENPAESEYFEAIGRANLSDMALMAGEDAASFRNYFNTLPTGILEYREGAVRFVRSNRSFRDYLSRFYHVSLSESEHQFDPAPFAGDAELMEHIRSCCANRSGAFFDAKLPDGSTAHSTIRWISTDPVTGNAAAALVIVSVSPPDLGTNYANIARALAANYSNLFYVNLRTEDFIEYSSSVGKDNLAIERHGTDFFAASRRDALTILYHEDQAAFVKAFTKENILRQLELQGTFTLTYRIAANGEPVYMSMKVMHMDSNNNYIIIGVGSIDSQMKEKERLDRIRDNELTYARIRALSGNYICLYTVNPANGQYVEYSASSEYQGLGLSKTGTDFFVDALLNGSIHVLPEDYPAYQAQMRRENVFRDIRERGMFSIQYRLLINGESQTVRLRAGLVKERDGEKLIVGVARTEG